MKFIVAWVSIFLASTAMSRRTMLLFEANATMNILHNQPSPNRWDKPCARIRSKLEATLEKHIRSVMSKGKPS